MNFTSNRRVGAAVMMSLLLVLAGCSGGFGPSDSDSSTTETTDVGADETETQDTTSSDSTGATTGAQTTTTTDGAESAASGPMLVVLDGRDAHLSNESAGETTSANETTSESENASASGNASFWIDDSHAWHSSNESIGLATALSRLGVDANESSLTYDGTTYRDGNETSVSYQVNGQRVDDPESYEVEDGDKVFVTVYTPNVSTPGRYFTANHPHPHGSLNVTVNGTTVDFTKEKHTHADKYFHFHGDEGAERWHAHSMNLTVEYAMSSFPGLGVTNDTFTYENTTYREGDGANVSVRVNSEEVQPSTYVLKDGDDVQITVETENGTAKSETTTESA